MPRGGGGNEGGEGDGEREEDEKGGPERGIDRTWKKERDRETVEDDAIERRGKVEEETRQRERERER